MLSERDAPYGLKGWIEEHRQKFPSNAELKERLDAWIETYEEQKSAQKAAVRESAEAGWTVVARQPGRKKTTDPETALAVGGISWAAAEAKAAKAQTRRLDGFYTHQKKERRQAALLGLRSKFEEDKRKIAKMRAVRKFKPY